MRIMGIGALLWLVLGLLGCATMKQPPEIWEKVSEAEWVYEHRVPSVAVPTYVHVTILDGKSLVFRWTYTCPAGSKMSEYQALWEPKQTITTSARDCDGKSGFALVGGFTNQYFIKTMPPKVQSLYINAPERPSPFEVEVAPKNPRKGSTV